MTAGHLSMLSRKSCYFFVRPKRNALEVSFNRIATSGTGGPRGDHRDSVTCLGLVESVPSSELQLVEKKINGGNLAVPGNDEISTSVCWRLTSAARYPLDPPAIAHFLRLGYWLISKVRVSSLDCARDSMDLVAASVDASLGIVEHAIFREDFVNCRAPTRRVILTEDVVKIAGQQGRNAIGHGCCFSCLDRVPLALMYQAALTSQAAVSWS